MRTTIDIDDPIMRDLKRLQRQEGKSLGRLVSDLLAVAIANAKGNRVNDTPPFEWITQGMGCRVDLDDKDALHDAMDKGPE